VTSRGRGNIGGNVGAIVRPEEPVARVAGLPDRLEVRARIGGRAERLRLAWGAGMGSAAERRVIRTRAAPERLTAATSRSHLDARTEEFLARLPLAARYACGSSIKFCQLAQGDADLYPRLSPVCEWDIAAGCAILAAAGGVASDPQGAPLRFGRADRKFLVPGFIAWGDPARAQLER